MAAVIIEKIDALHSKRDFEMLYDYALTVSTDAAATASAQCLWRFSRACFDCAEERTAKKEALAREGVAFGNAAVAIDDACAEAYKWTAICLSMLGDFLPVKQRLIDAVTMKDYAVKANTLGPNDATTLHLLGRWAFGIASIGWLERKAAELVFTVPTASFEETLDWLMKADAASTETFPRNMVYIARTLQALKRNKEAKEWVQKVLAHTPLSKSQEAVRAEAMALKL